MDTKPKLIVLCGLPGMGKTTATQHLRSDPAWMVYSTDDYVETCAEYYGISYDEAFESHMKAAKKEMNLRLETALADGRNILWDQTNLTRKKRAQVLRRIPETYETECWHFPLYAKQMDSWRLRLSQRTGKTIPNTALSIMLERYQSPQLDEGFDSIVVQRTGLGEIYD